jgi:hypothetical protein
MWERFGAHGDLYAVFESDPPQSVIDEMADLDDVFDITDADHISVLRNRRGSRTMSEASGVWSRSISRATTGMQQRRRLRDAVIPYVDDLQPDVETET